MVEEQRGLARAPQVTLAEPLGGMHQAPVARSEGEVVTRYQRARRLIIWRGSFSALFTCSVFMLASALAGSITQ